MTIAISETLLEQPMYTAAEAGRLAGLSSVRVSRWLQGYSYQYESQSRRRPPVIERTGSVATSYASFLDLVDLLFAREFVDRGISLQKLRKALDEAREILKAKHFAHRNFFTDGKKIYLQVKEEGDAILELLRGGQWVISDIIMKLATQIDFDRNLQLARRWYPLGRESLIVVDPLVSFGRPSIARKGITTSNVYDLFIAEGRKEKAVCKWLDLTSQEVEKAVRFEIEIAA